MCVSAQTDAFRRASLSLGFQSPTRGENERCPLLILTEIRLLISRWLDIESDPLSLSVFPARSPGNDAPRLSRGYFTDTHVVVSIVCYSLLQLERNNLMSDQKPLVADDGPFVPSGEPNSLPAGAVFKANTDTWYNLNVHYNNRSGNPITGLMY